MRHILGFIALLALFCLSVHARDEYIPRRALKGLDINDDKFCELPVQSFPKDGYIVDVFRVLPKREASNGFYQIWDEVHLDEVDGAVKLLSADADSNLLWQVMLNDFKGVQRDPKLIDFSDGSLLAVWESSSAGTNNVNLWCMRVGEDGKFLWQVPCSLSCAPGNQRNPSLAHLPNGGIAAVWEDHRNGDSDIYYQEIMPDGSPVYTPDGVAVEKVEGAQLRPGFVLDENGFAQKLFWQDYKDLNYPICTVAVDLDDLAVPEGGVLGALVLAACAWAAGRRR